MKGVKMKYPELNSYRANDFENTIKALAPSYLPEWKPSKHEAGWAVAKAFSKMSEQIVDQLNQVPKKLFLSYLDQLGFVPKEAQASKTAVTFHLRKKGTNSVDIPQKTQLMHPSKAVFETQSTFTAQKANIVSAYFVNGSKDSVLDIWSQLEAKKDASFNSEESLQAHELYIRDDKLFLFKKNYGREQYINLHLPYLHQETEWFYWGTDKHDTQRWIAFEQSVQEKEYISLKKKSPSPSSPTIVNGEHGYWIKAVLGKITQSIEVEKFQIQFTSQSGLDYSFSNDVPIDFHEKNFYPFGEEPQLEDCWYMASAEAFSKSGHEIHFNFNTIVPLVNEREVSLSWEYNDGKTWKQLNVNHTKKGVHFIVPNEINLFKYNDIKNYWIRLRIVAGGYAKTTLNTAQVITKETTSDGIKTTTFDITQNTIQKEYTAPKLSFNYIKVSGVSRNFNNIMIHHNHNYKQYKQMPQPIFKSFKPQEKSLYLGFNHPFDSGLVSIFFEVAIRQIKISRTLHTSYTNKLGKQTKLKIEDNTQALQKNGTLSFLAPVEQKEEMHFGIFAYWIKIELIEKVSKKNHTERLMKSTYLFDIKLGDNDKGDIIKGIYSNTVWAKHHHGGKMGDNGEIHTLTKLLNSIPAIKEVSNPLPITGGAKRESNQEVINKAPSKIRHRNTAINQQDIEALVYEASSNIAKVKLFLSMDKNGNYHSGGNTLVLLPLLDDPMPKPSFSLRQQIEHYLSSRISAVSTFEVIAPEYIRINVTATLHTKTIAYINRIKKQTLMGLDAYLHPITGKSSGLGWEFSEAVCLSNLLGWLEHIEDVEYISHIEVTLQSKTNSVTLNNSKNTLLTLPPYALIASGLHKIKVEEV